MARQSPSDTKDQAALIREAWTNIGPDEVIVGLTLAELETGIADLDAAKAEIADLQDRLTSARNERMDKRYTLWGLVKRARVAAKAQYGDDSDEYERFGGTRSSERKSPSSGG